MYKNLNADLLKGRAMQRVHTDDSGGARERERERESGYLFARERESVCVCEKERVCMCARKKRECMREYVCACMCVWQTVRQSKA